MFQNELGPVNEIEFFVYIVMLLASIILNSLIFSDIYVIFEMMIEKSK